MYKGILALDNLPLSVEEVEKCSFRMSEDAGDWKPFFSTDHAAVFFEDTSGGCRDTSNEKTVVVRNQLLIAGVVELHNRAELAEKVHSSAGIPVSGVSDLELVLQAYEKWDENCVRHFLGNFSFAIWDCGKKRFFAVVDHVGIESLYFQIKFQKYVLLSNSFSVLAKNNPAPPDNEFVLSYLLHCFQQTDRTNIDGISILPPGSYLKIDKGKLSVKRYWNPDVKENIERKRVSKDAAEQLKELMIEAVRCRVEVPGPVGIMLSGGLDSSSLACIAQKVLSSQGRTLLGFSKVLPPNLVSGIVGEERFIQAVERHLDLKVYYVDEMTITTQERLEEYFEFSQCFPFNPFPFLTQPLAEMVYLRGCRTVLNGFGGDETVSTFGLSSLALLFKYRYWGEFLENLNSYRKVNSLPMSQVFRGKVLPPLLPESVKMLYRKIRRREKKIYLGNRFVRQSVLHDTNAGRFLEKHIGYIDGRYLDPREELFDLIQSTYFRPILQFYDCFGKMIGIKYENPFLDKRIIEFMLTVHPKEYLTGGWPRSLIRRSMRGVLPEEVRMRSCKTPFNVGVPISKCLLESEELILQVLSQKSSGVWEIIDRAKLEQEYMVVKNAVAHGSPETCGWLAEEVGRCINVAAFYQWKGI